MSSIIVILFCLIILGSLFSYSVLCFFQLKRSRGWLMLLCTLVAIVLFALAVSNRWIIPPDSPIKTI